MQCGDRRPFQRGRLRYDPTFASEVAYCYERGIPHSRFLAKWSPEDRAKVIAYGLEKSAVCPGCGSAEWQWDPEQGGSTNAFDAVVETCPGCQRKDWLRDDHEKLPSGSSVVLVPRAVADQRSQTPNRVKRRRRSG